MPDFFGSLDDHELTSDTDVVDNAGEHDRHPSDGMDAIPGDLGDFTLEQRLAARGLLRGPFISGAQDKDIYHEIVRSAGTLSAFLDNLLVKLVIDEVGEIAYLRDWDPLPEGAPSLFRRRPLTHMQTAVVLNLRKKLAHAVSGERTIVDANHIFEETLPYQPDAGTDRAKQRTTFDNAWNVLADHGVLKRTPTPGRWEVSPVLSSIFSAEEIAAVHHSYTEWSERKDAVGTTTVEESMENNDE
ncbi:DUF4194 domain-containing protein [Corynebacterium hylobatis]|uniref:DUF4194 domain-containing protein n=1 Tax=Corynebacterium hylobatis TaxID=1859290 RepID=A0A430I2B4_9CORY|nr:DUF4194 domain-containing protein [Corynebacterium hylobatis]RSZ66087.1 DUF4194 domain-containing protein [Corynebacterium hylobatis]